MLLAYSRGIISSRRPSAPVLDATQDLRTPEKTQTRQVAFMQSKVASTQPDVLEQMRQRIDSDQGKHMITTRFATVEPVFGNLRYNKRLSRFTLRSKAKVDGQFKLHAMMHNIEKFAGSRYAQLARSPRRGDTPQWAATAGCGAIESANMSLYASRTKRRRQCNAKGAT